MIVTTTSTIPNEDIVEIIDIVHDRVVLGANLFSDISAAFSDVFGGKNVAYEKRLNQITNQVIEALKIKAIKIKADALVGLKIDIDEISGGGKSMFTVNAIATAVKIARHKPALDIVSIDSINSLYTKNTIIKLIADGKFNPRLEWVEVYLRNNAISEAFIPYINWIIKNYSEYSWKDEFELYVSNFSPDKLFDSTLQYFSKDARLNIESNILDILFKYLQIDYNKVNNYFKTSDDISLKRFSLNILLLENHLYTDSDFLLIAELVDMISEAFPKTSIDEVGTGIFNKGGLYWRCKCGTKNDKALVTICSNCNLDEYGNKSFIPRVDLVTSHLKKLLLGKTLLDI